MSRLLIAGSVLVTLSPLAACGHARAPSATSPRTARPQAITIRATPAPTPTVTEVTLPMTVVNSEGGTLLYVPIRVNGRGPFEFVLDTGSSNSSVDRSLVRELHLPRTGQLHRVQGVTGSGTVPLVKVRRWTLGGVPLHGKTLSVVDLGMGVAGLLGADELRRFGEITLDFRHNRLIIQPN